MSSEHSPDAKPELGTLQGHMIGFVDSEVECRAVAQALNMAGVSDSQFLSSDGVEGLRLLNQMLGGSLWGETAEHVLKQGEIELSHGHFVLIVDSETREDAARLANIAMSVGGHGFNYFGLLADEQLTK